MTTSSDNKLSAELGEQRISWARQTLGVSPETSQAEISRQILTHLADKNFMPSEDFRAAAITLVNADAVPQYSPNDTDPFMQYQEQGLCCEIAAFAEEFFDLPPVDRKRRWEEIFAKCGDYIVPQTRILALRPGLSVEPAKCRLRNEYEKELANCIFKAFTVIDPSKRFPLQLAFLQSRNWKPKKLRIAAKRLLDKYPKVAALAPDLIEDIRAVQAPQPQLDTTTGDETGTPKWVIVVGIFIVISVIKAVVRDEHNNRSVRQKPYDERVIDYGNTPSRFTPQRFDSSRNNNPYQTSPTSDNPFPSPQRSSNQSHNPYDSSPFYQPPSELPAVPREDYPPPDNNRFGRQFENKRSFTRPINNRPSPPSARQQSDTIQLPGLIPDPPKRPEKTVKEQPTPIQLPGLDLDSYKRRGGATSEGRHE